MADFDLAIIGGGINGTGLARDAAGRGIRVLLVEMNDLGSGTSSASSKLIHGGLRYLEHRAFRLVREALNEREVLLGMAPQLVRPMRFMLPPLPGVRSPLLLRFGLILYDLLGARKLLPASRTVDLTHHVVGQPLQRTFRYGFEYSDCGVDDSRLVVLNALDAAEHGATIRTRTRCTRAERRHDWELVLNARGRRDVKTARVLVNASGPWIGAVAETVIRQPLPRPARLIKGSHIVVRRRFEHDYGYLLEAPDRRVVFVLPFAEEFILIGTTDENFVGDLNSPVPDVEEITYLCGVVNRYFRDAITPDELVWSFAGVRSLYDDGADKPEDVTRDYEVVLDERPEEAPLLTIYGGKITTHRKLAEAVMLRIGQFFEARPPWTAASRLPGGEFAPQDFDAEVAELLRRWPFLSVPHARRLMRAYGRRAERILKDAKTMDDLGQRFAVDLTASEVRYLVENEWAQNADDILWRRSKLGLKIASKERLALDRFIASGMDTSPSKN
ncbi:MAG TPA: glycerol-3-phosphate dehydrogenase [Pseudolabrys sp.]|nr:glycerol-3-phosphate dehydrogenase [Pseudolabrys sp.]